MWKKWVFDLPQQDRMAICKIVRRHNASLIASIKPELPQGSNEQYTIWHTPEERRQLIKGFFVGLAFSFTHGVIDCTDIDRAMAKKDHWQAYRILRRRIISRFTQRTGEPLDPFDHRPRE